MDNSSNQMSLPANRINADLLKATFNYHEEGYLVWKNKNHSSRQRKASLGAVNQNGYIQTRIWGKSFKIHRLIWTYFNGDPGTLVEIDHINGDKHDNRIENLRLSTRAGNTRNVSLRKNNKSGIKGVSWYKATKKWKAQIQHNNKKIGLGYFQDPEEAKIVVMKAREKLHAEFANHGHEEIKGRTGRMVDGVFIKDQ